MYKVFIKENPIILIDSKNNLDSFVMLSFESVLVPDLLSLFKENRLRGIYLFHNDIAKMWTDFKINFKVVEAAGGLVKNNKNEVLMIYRLNHWDLPKGKIEHKESKEEAAIREVQEECGITNLKIIKALSTTYHIYFENDVPILKITYWYEMINETLEHLSPQLEEGIVDVKYIPINKLNNLADFMFENIKILLNESQCL